MIRLTLRRSNESTQGLHTNLVYKVEGSVSTKTLNWDQRADPSWSAAKAALVVCGVSRVRRRGSNREIPR